VGENPNVLIRATGAVEIGKGPEAVQELVGEDLRVAELRGL
jgi:hypothetical protein